MGADQAGGRLTFFLFILRVIPKNFTFTVRATLYLFRREESERVFAYLDYISPSSGELTRAQLDFDRFSFVDEDGVEVEFPASERDLGRVKELRFADGAETLQETPYRFEVYSRLPTPPPGATLKTVTASAHMRPRVRGS